MNTLQNLGREYVQGGGRPIAMDFRSSYQDLAQQYRTEDLVHPNHIHRYTGRILSQIPFVLLSMDDFQELNGPVLDPFAGSGTILLESVMNPLKRRDAIGVEINPVGRLISKVKTTSISVDSIGDLSGKLRRSYESSRFDKDYVPDYENLPVWFSQHATRNLAKLRRAICDFEGSDELKDVLWLCFSAVVRKVSRANPYIAPPVLIHPEKYEGSKSTPRTLERILEQSENPHTWRIFKTHLLNTIPKLGNGSHATENGSRAARARIVWDNAMDIRNGSALTIGRIEKKYARKLPSSSVDLILTSPPYLTAQKYIRSSKLELLWLGYSREEIRSLEVQSIGSEMLSKAYEITELGVEPIDSLVSSTSKFSFERGVMVHSYFSKMRRALAEMMRVIRPGGYAILVLGQNKVIEDRVNTYSLIRTLAVELGFKELVTFRDHIRSRSMLTSRNNPGGLVQDEFIIVLQKE